MHTWLVSCAVYIELTNQTDSVSFNSGSQKKDTEIE